MRDTRIIKGNDMVSFPAISSSTAMALHRAKVQKKAANF